MEWTVLLGKATTATPSSPALPGTVALKCCPSRFIFASEFCSCLGFPPKCFCALLVMSNRVPWPGMCAFHHVALSDTNTRTNPYFFLNFNKQYLPDHTQLSTGISISGLWHGAGNTGIVRWQWNKHRAGNMGIVRWQWNNTHQTILSTGNTISGLWHGAGNTGIVRWQWNKQYSPDHTKYRNQWLVTQSR